jgi:hypothetical protein
MIWKFLAGVFTFMAVAFMILLLFFYWVFPITNYEFSLQPGFTQNYNFSLTGNSALQFYENMRYPSRDISYKIYDDCNMQKRYDAETAIDILNNMTELNLYPANNDEWISIHCEDKIKVEERFFIAGEGGPINITRTENFNVILKGGVLILRDSNCERPNVVIHELLHALGFDHSENPNNIMYPISKCGQTIGEDIINTIDNLYSVPSNPDLSFENVSAVLRGRLLDLNVSIRNNGLKDSEKFRLIVYVDGEKVKDFDIDEMEIGYGLSINLQSLPIKQLSVDVLTLEIDYGFEELNKENNKMNLELKKLED